MSDGAEALHYLLELPAAPPRSHDAEEAWASTRNPIYAILHEASYADGVRDALVGRPVVARRVREPGCFTGEHVFPWMFEDYGALAPHREAAELLAEHEWPRLYDGDG